MVNGMSEDQRKGMTDYQNHIMSMGLPAVRSLFRHMLRAANLRGSAKQAVLAEIRDFSPVTEEGCMEVHFYDSVLKKMNLAYLTLRECPKDHNLDAQLNKIKGRCPADRWTEVLKHLSMLVNTGISVYNQIASAHAPLVQKLMGKDKVPIQVDMRNTTLLLDPEWRNRVGIYVDLQADVELELASSKKAPQSKD